MKMKFFSFCVAALLAANAHSQSSAHLKAGINLANVSVTDEGRVEEANKLTSFHVGVVGDIPFGKVFSLQPGLLFTGKGSKTQSGDATSSTYFKATTNPYYIETPVNLVAKLPIGGGSKLFAGAGGYMAVGIAGKNKSEGKNLGLAFENENDIEFSDDDPSTLNYEEGAGLGILKRFDYGLNGTAGVEGKSMILSINYGHGLAKIQSGTNNNEDNNNKHRVLGFSIGFKF